MELTVLGCSGSYGSHPAGPCSGYLLREGDTAIWLDCGNGTFPNLQQHIDPAELSAVVITHEHPTIASTSTGSTCSCATGGQGRPPRLCPRRRGAAPRWPRRQLG